MWNRPKCDVLRNTFDNSLNNNIELDVVFMQFIEYIAYLHRK
jgi:hypothetical protein